MLAALFSFAAVNACAGNDEAVEELEHESVVITQWNDSTELFLEYPHVLAGQATGNWAIHLSSMKDFKPIRSGTLTVRFLSAEGAAETFTIDSVARDGIFLLDPVIARPGMYQVELALESPQVSSRHMLPEVRVFAQEDEIPYAEEEERGGGIAFLKEQQWQIAWEVIPAREDTVQNTIAAPGEVVAPDGALVEISAPMDGIAAAAANRGAPSVGQSVRQGQVLVVLSPTAQDGGFAQARSRLERLEREVERDERLYAAGAIPQRRLEEARHDLEVARAEVSAMGAGGVGGDYRLRLTSPINGVVARRSFVPGGRVEAGTPLFTIVDPRTAWLRVQVPAAAATGIPASARATFTTDGSQQVRTTSRLVSVGSVLDPRTRTVPVVFEIADAGALFTFGQLAQVAVPSGGNVTGVVIPNQAIIDDNGTPVAYVQAGGEEFERRVLSLGASDGVRTHVVAGIRPGEMIVTTGAFQVRLASMSGDDFAGGHAH
jgi:RND family efflux transporter MFP subunit